MRFPSVAYFNLRPILPFPTPKKNWTWAAPIPAETEKQDPFRVLTKHDSNNLEVKMDFHWQEGRCPETSSVEVTCVFPSGLSLKGFSKNELWTDFRSRTRLLVGMHELQHHGKINLESSIESFKKTLMELEASSQNRLAPEDKTALLAVQAFGYQVCENLKKKDEAARKSLFLAYSLLNTAKKSTFPFDSIADEIRSTYREIEEVRSALNLLKPVDEALYVDCAQYIHYQCVRYLSSITSEYQNHKSQSQHQGEPHFSPRSSRIEAALDELCRRENEYLKKSGIHGSTGTSLGESEYLIKMAALKRFFHSSTFVDTTREEYIKRFAEPLASGAALVAAVIGATIQKMSEPGFLQIGAGGIGLISLGVFLYVFRDRMKDRGRSFFTEWLGRRLPEIRDSLVYQGKKVGVARKWLQIQKFTRLPEDIILFKRRLERSKLESESVPDVLCYKESFALGDNPDSFASGSSSTRHLHHILRINLRRFLKFMDDSQKEVSFLSGNGKIETRQVARLYPFFIFVRKKIHYKGAPLTESDLLGYRVLVSKEGIQSAEPIGDLTRASIQPLGSWATQN